MAAAASLQRLLLLGNSNPNLCGNGAPKASRRPPCSSTCRPSEAGRCPLRLGQSPPLRNRLGSLPIPEGRQFPGLVTLAASHEESKHRRIQVRKDKKEVPAEAKVSQKVWKESQEAFVVYCKKAMEILMETSEKLKIQADIAQHDLSILAKEISEEGKGYLSAAAKNPPDFVKDIVEAYASVDKLKSMSAVRDFYLGIPYGAFLSLGGFLHFMLTGSIPAIRFGVILGTAILALSVLSLQSWKNGKATSLLIKSQTAIAAIIFLRQWNLWSKRGTVPTLLMFLISGAMVAFYAYRIRIDAQNKGPRLERESEA